MPDRAPSGPAEPYTRVATPAARRALEEHYDSGASLYKFWASPGSVLGALLRGWARSRHPAHIHYAWDLESAPSLDEALGETVRRALALLALEGIAAPRLYEPGCGLAGALTQAAGLLPHATLTGVSLVAGQLHIGRRRLAARRLSGVQLCCANYLSAPFPERCFDGIYAIETFVHIPAEERGRLFREMFRVLAPGRRLVCLDGVTLRPPATPAERGYVQDVMDGWTLPVPPTPQELCAHAAAAGFELLHEEDATAHIYASARRIAAIARAVLLPLSALSRLPLLGGLTAPLGFASPRHAARFVVACRSQVRLFELGLGGYYVHVLGRPAGG